MAFNGLPSLIVTQFFDRPLFSSVATVRLTFKVIEPGTTEENFGLTAKRVCKCVAAHYQGRSTQNVKWRAFFGLKKNFTEKCHFADEVVRRDWLFYDSKGDTMSCSVCCRYFPHRTRLFLVGPQDRNSCNITQCNSDNNHIVILTTIIITTILLTNFEHYYSSF